MDESKVKELVQPILDGEDLFLVDVVIKGNVGNQKILVFADGDKGISIDQCGRVSRQLGHLIEEQDLMATKYTLEVSSPGLDFPLTIDRQYHKNIGRELEIELANGESVEGELLSVDKEKVKIKKKNIEGEYSFQEIKKSKVKISFK